MRKISSGDYEPNDYEPNDYEPDDYEPKKEPYCKCGYPDMPGQCPGWRNCPMCAEDEDEEPKCPKCGGDMWLSKHLFSTEYGPNVPDCCWWTCDDCDYQTEPE